MGVWLAGESAFLHLSDLLCRNSRFSNGGVCNRHCSALLRKQVFPELYRPLPLEAADGHVNSMGLSYSDLTLDAVSADFSVSGCETRRASRDWTNVRVLGVGGAVHGGIKTDTHLRFCRGFWRPIATPINRLVFPFGHGEGARRRPLYELYGWRKERVEGLDILYGAILSQIPAL